MVGNRPLRVTLISPKGPLYRHSGGIFKKSLRYQPLTLTTLTALAPAELNIDFTLIDEGIEDLPDHIDADLVGMTVITGTAPRAYALAAKLRTRGIPVVLGGPHVTLMPDEAAANADAIVVGYAETSWPRLLRDFAAGAMRARYDQGADFSLDTPVTPDRNRLNKKHYITQAVFEATRACAHACEFCVVPSAWGRKQYQKPVAHVVQDIQTWGAKRNIFLDLNLISDRKYARKLFTALIPLNIRWFGLVTSLIGRDPELMQLMARSGCSGVLIGFESISQTALGGMKKGFNDPDLYANLIDDLHRLNILIYGCFVFGQDEDTPDVFDRTADFAVQTGIDLPRFAIQTPFPGTPLYTRLADEGRILTRDWELYDGQHVVFQPKAMSVAELQEGHVRAWQKVYSAPNIARRLAHSRTQLPISLLANFGYRYYANHLHSHYTCDWPVGYAGRAA
nr:cobalamin-dependent protein [Aliiroseovarius subalbicans]